MKTEYFKCDLHIHTDHSNNTKDSDYKGEFSVDELVRKLDDGNIKLFSLTDHNLINKDAYLEYYEKYSENDMKLLVGVEFDIHREENLFEALDILTAEKKRKYHKYHSLLIFRTTDVEEIDKRINFMYRKLQDQYNKEYGDTTLDFFNENLKHRLTSLDRLVETFRGEDFLIISHGNKSSNIVKAYKGNISEAQAMILLGVINSVEMGPKLEAITHFNSGFDKILQDDYKDREDVPYVVFSDNHELKYYPNYSSEQIVDERPFTWLRGTPCFETLRLSFVDPSSRIHLSQNKPEKPIKYLKSIKLDLFNADGEITEKVVNFSSGINTIIGGRSSGKSLLLNSILHNFVQSKDKSKITMYQTEESKVVEISSILGKMNLGGSYSDSNNCVVLSYTQDEIISLFDHDGNKLEEELPFIKYEEDKKELKMSNTIEIIDELASSYETFYKNRHNKMMSITKSDLTLSNTKKSVDYQYKKAIHTINQTIKENPSVSKSSIESIDEVLTHFNKMISLTFKKEPLFNPTEIDQLNEIMEMIVRKRNLLKNEYFINSFKISLLENINDFIKDELNEIMSNIDSLITQANDRIKKEIHNATCFINSKYKFYASIKKLEEVDLNFDVLEKDISSDYKLRTEIPYKLKIDSIYDFFKNNITGFDINHPIESLLTMPYEDSKIRVFRKTNEPKDFYFLINKLKDDIKSSTIPKYSIIEKGVSRNLSSDHMSPGKKASVYLEIMLTDLKKVTEPTILIIDQPEDNLDNLFITEKLVEYIRNLRGLVQVILVTHNASVAINTDSDNIVIAKNSDTSINYTNNGLENLEFREDVCKLLDGGHHTFDQRYHKYDIPNRKIYEPIREDR